MRRRSAHRDRPPGFGWLLRESTVVRAGCLLTVLASGAGRLDAQILDQVCRPLERPQVGAWARYHLATTEGDSTEVRLAVVGRAVTPAGEHVWQESVLRGAGAETVIQSLVPAAPYDPATIRRAIIHAPGRAPLELPESALRSLAGRQTGTGLDACRDGEALGWETLTVPAGQVRALRVRYTRDGRTAETWLAPAIPFAVVRTVVAGSASVSGIELTLLGYGHDATPTVPLPDEH
jgi:hypothetical protein